jgi:hypothetical protein
MEVAAELDGRQYDGQTRHVMGCDILQFRTVMWLGRGLGMMRTGTRRLGNMRMRTGRPGARDD